MIRAIIARLLLSVPVVIGIVLFGFLLMQLVPGDAARVVAGPEATDDVVEQIRREMGLDRPVLTQFAMYLQRIAVGDMGYSMISNKAVLSELTSAIGPTLELMIGSMLWSIPTGIALGTLAAFKRGTLIDRGIMAFSVAGVSMPIFFVCLVMIQLFGVTWQIFPFIGRPGPWYTAAGFMSLVLPVFSLGVILIGPIARMTRSSVLDVLRLDHVRTARSKGISEFRVVTRHGLRNALIPVVTVIGLQAGYLLSGAVVTETIFSWPGIGRLAIGAILSSDFTVAQGCILMFGIGFILINLIVDVAYSLLDPRVRK